jgi:hypothetical protein
MTLLDRCIACEGTLEIPGRVLCERCVSRLRGRVALCPEQITSHIEAERSGATAALIDEWGRVYPLAAKTSVGRHVGPGCLSIAESSVSRTHAELARSVAGQWIARDAGSSNGTWVNGERIDARRLEHDDIVTFGYVSLLFVARPVTAPSHENRHVTMKPAQLYEDDSIEETFSGLRKVDLRMASPSGGGGGVLEIDGRSVQLTYVQLELFRVLSARMMDEAGRDERVRGFVRSSELLATIGFDTPKPDDNHLKQLVRRVRRALSRAGIPDAIESRHGFGYRLSVLPRARPDGV